MRKGVNIVAFSLILWLFVILSLFGCYQTTHNVKATDDLAGKKILAGRFLFYDNDTPLRDSSLKFVMFYNKQGDKEVQALEPDADGYIYIPATAGRYNIGGVKVIVKINEVFNFNFSAVPSIGVNENDSAVNFGTIRVKFTQSTGEKAVAFLTGLSRAHISVAHVPDYSETRAEISARIGPSIPLRDVKVIFLKRIKK